MGIYNNIFVNHYNYYGRIFKPNRMASVGFLSLIQIVHILIASSFFKYFGLLNGHKESVYTSYILTMVVIAFNFFYYNQKKLDRLLIGYKKLSEDQKRKHRYLSVSISMLTLMGYIMMLVYFTYS